MKKIDNIIRYNFEKRGYININHVQLNNHSKIIELSYILKNSQYESFRIIYLRGKEITGEEIVSIKKVTLRKLSSYNSYAKMKSELKINIIKDRMNDLLADGYYMVHFCPLDRINSNNYIRQTKYFYEHLKGFQAHIILNSNSYVYIKMKKEKIHISKQIKIYPQIKKNIFFINSKNSLANFILKIINNSSIIMIINNDNMQEIIFDFLNNSINKNILLLAQYLNKLKKQTNSKVIFITERAEIYEKSLRMLENHIFDSRLFYTRKHSQLYLGKENCEK